MNVHTNFLTALIGGQSCTEQETQAGLAALVAAGVSLSASATDADGRYTCGREEGTDRYGQAYLKASGYILTPSRRIAAGVDSKDAGGMGPFCPGRMDERELFLTVARARFTVDLGAAMAAMGVAIAPHEIYQREAIPAIVARINNNPATPDSGMAEPVSASAAIDADALKAARKAAKQAEKAAAIAARKGR